MKQHLLRIDNEDRQERSHQLHALYYRRRLNTRKPQRQKLTRFTDDEAWRLKDQVANCQSVQALLSSESRVPISTPLRTAAATDDRRR